MSNEAAERLRETLTEDGWADGSLAFDQFDDALAAERRATVERAEPVIERFFRERGTCFTYDNAEKRKGLPVELARRITAAILDEEAAR